MCENDAGLFISSAQASAFEEIEDYLEMGPYLASLCCVVWLLGLVKDVDAAIQQMLAVVRLRGPTTRIRVGKRQRIEALSTARVVWVTGVQLLRIIVAITLGSGGLRLLCKTVSLEGLLRTSVALKFERDQGRPLSCSS